MPTYQYRCRTCSSELEVFQKFTDDPLTDCPECGGSLRKVFNAVGIVFKGSGFYATDSRKADAAASKPDSSSKPDKPAETSTPAPATRESSSTDSKQTAAA